jgi:serine/threonine-protein kinase
MPICPTCRTSYPEGQFCPKDGAHLVSDSQETMAGRPASTDPILGKLIADRFRVIARLGAGGMGTVYEAEHLYIQKRVALKLLRPEITASADAVARFQREALAASTIGHENIVAIDDFGRLADGQVYLTMEFLDGDPLNEVLEREPLSIPQILDVAIQTCHGLAAAHAKGIIHRDMKPENIFLVDGGSKVKILDFGIAKVVRADSNTNLTKTGAVFGTPNYMAPEQALGRPIDHRVDVYSMGIIIYQMATGRLPFEADSFVAILTQHVTEPPPSPRSVAPAREIPEALEAIILKAVAKEPAERYQDMGELVAALLDLRRLLVGDAPLKSNLRLSKIRPPAASPADLPLQLIATPAPSGVTATAGELVPPVRPPRRRGMLVGLTAVAFLLVGGGVAAFLLLRQPSRRAEPVVAARPPATDRGVERVAPKPAAPERVKVFVVSDPLGAEVFRDGRSLGITALSIDAAAGEKLTVTLKRKGFQPREVEIEAADGMMKTIPLTPVGRVGVKKVLTSKRRPAAKKKRSDHDHGDGHDEVMNPYQ